jgi:hypothetical protein
MLLALLLLASEFGRAGQFVPTGSVSFSRSSTGSDSQVDFAVATDLSWFVADHFALGVSLRYQLVQATTNGVDQGTQSSAGLAPIAAYDFALSPLVSFFPSAGLEFLSQPGDRKAWGLTAFAPVLFHPAPHFFLGVGPSFFAELTVQSPTATDKTMTFGARTVLGGYF